MHRPPATRRPDRRGVTLVEMMVTVALVVLIMTIIVSVFRSATGAVRGVQISQELDSSLRRLEATLRQDLSGATARFTPPLNPKDNLGYFEYGENAPFDLQGEDTDDWMAFTVKAPEGQPFQGRYWDPSGNQAIQPIIITSEYAEVLYFLRNGNLYRRVLLIVPNLATGLSQNGGFTPTYSGGQPVGWMGVNDISARPPRFASMTRYYLPIPNTLGDLTNRQNRAFRPRFCDDYADNATGTNVVDGEPDDTNQDNIPDFYPTLFPNVLGTALINEGTSPNRRAPTSGVNEIDSLPFPFLFPGAYTKDDSTVNGSSPTLGAIHGIAPLNHSPLDLGDNLPIPNPATPAQLQTYFGWPTWRETLSPNWLDPFLPVNRSTADRRQVPGLSWNARVFLPPMTTDPLQVVNDTGATAFTSTTTPFRLTAQPFNDGLASASSHFALNSTAPGDYPWRDAWEDDLIMTGVRSFDIKAYDPSAPTVDPTLSRSYYDLGYGAFDATGTARWVAGFAAGTSYTTASQYLQTFGHEGRIPPLPQDLRVDPHYPTYLSAGVVTPNDISDANTDTLRLRRVWDSWSTDYTNAPDLPLNPLNGPLFGNRPVYPSYPAPYPAPLRGIQIQIRLSNQPDSDHLRPLTIRQDFADKL